MTVATIKFEGMAPLEGAAEAGGDYITFRTAACLSPQQLNELHRAMIDFDGQSETVLVESTDLQRCTTSKANDDQEALQLILRRNTPPVA